MAQAYEKRQVSVRNKIVGIITTISSQETPSFRIHFRRKCAASIAARVIVWYYSAGRLLLRGTTVNTTYGTHKKKLYISRILLARFGPVYFGPP